MSFANAPQAIDEGQAYEPIRAEDAAFDDEKIADLAAAKLVVQCAEEAEKFVQSKTLVQEWNAADELYRAYVTAETWPNSKNPRSHIPMPVVMEAIESLLPQAHMAFFSDAQPFLLDPKGKTTPEAARAMAHVVCWAIDESGFEEEIRKTLKSTFQYGIGVGKVGWETHTHSDKKYRQGDKGVEYTPVEHEVACPTFENVDIHCVLVDPRTNCHDIRTSNYVIFQKYINARELDDLRDQGYKNVPSREFLKTQLISNSEPTTDSLLGNKYYTWRENQAQLPTEAPIVADPLNHPLELLEYWDGERVITLLQRKIVIRNDEHEMGGHPFRSCAFIDVLNSFYGYGVAKLLAGEQSLQGGVLNKWVDFLSLKMNPMWFRKGGVAVNSQNIMAAPGKVVNEGGELAPVEMGDLTEEALTVINASEQRAARRVGANFGPEMPTQAMRTAEGVQAFTSGVQVRLQYFIENFANLVFIPVIQDFICLCKDNLKPEEINAILSDRDGKNFEGDIMDVYNGKYSVDVLSSVKLSGRRAMAQMLIPIMQMLGQPAVMDSFNVQAKKFNWVEFFEQVFDVTGWPGDNLIVDMTPEDQQRMQAMNPAVVKAQADQQKLQQTQQHDKEMQEAKTDGQAGVAIVKSILKQHEVPPAKPLAQQAPGGSK